MGTFSRLVASMERSSAYHITDPERYALERWLRKSFEAGDITGTYFVAATKWLLDPRILLDGKRATALVQDKELYCSFLTETKPGYPGSFWHEIERVLEFPINVVLRKNSLWRVGQPVLVYLSLAGTVKGIVVEVLPLGCKVRIPHNGAVCEFDNDHIAPRLEGSWSPFTSMGEV